MSIVSFNFRRNEFACKCGCGFDTVDVDLVRTLERVRQEFGGQPVIITSGCRCPSHNASVGGSVNSKHLIGQAADFYILGVAPKRVYEWMDVEFRRKYGLGLYNAWVHLDVRREKARWEQ